MVSLTEMEATKIKKWNGLINKHWSVANGSYMMEFPNFFLANYGSDFGSNSFDI